LFTRTLIQLSAYFLFIITPIGVFKGDDNLDETIEQFYYYFRKLIQNPEDNATDTEFGAGNRVNNGNWIVGSDG